MPVLSRSPPASDVPGDAKARVKDEFSAAPPPRRVARAGVAHRHRDHAGERALAGASGLRAYNDSYTSFVSAMKVALPLLALVHTLIRQISI